MGAGIIAGPMPRKYSSRAAREPLAARVAVLQAWAAEAVVCPSAGNAPVGDRTESERSGTREGVGAVP